MTIKDYFSKIIKLRMIFLILRFLITSINTIIGLFILSVLIDKIFPLPIVVFHIYWFFILIAILLFFVNLIIRVVELKLKPYNYLRNAITKFIKFDKIDDIINAYFLEEKLISPEELNFSPELANKFIEKVKKQILKISPSKIVDFDKIKKVLPFNLVLIGLFFILYSFPPYALRVNVSKILFTRKPEILGIFISPKNIKVHYRESCEIKVIVEKDYEIYTPVLFIKTKTSNKFYKVNFEQVSYLGGRKVHKYKIKSVEEKIYYKIKFRGIYSKVFIIEPIVYPEISELKIIVEPPSYTKMPIYEITSFNETKYLYGSKVKFKGRTNKDIEEVYLVLSNKKKQLNIEEDKKSFYGDFITKENAEIWFEIIDSEKLSNLNNITKYKINVVMDAPPQIEILSPQDELMVEPNSIIPIVFSCKDDISVSNVDFVYKIKDNEKKLNIKQYAQPTKEIIDEYRFDLGKITLNFGDIVEYYLIVYDNDTILGPKYNISSVNKIEIFSYEKQNKMIKEEVGKFNEYLLKILSKEIELKDNLLKISTTHFDSYELEKLINSHLDTKDCFKIMENMLSSILDKMTNDPYTSFDTYFEFKNMFSSIEEIKNNVLPSLISGLKNKDFELSKSLQEQIINYLQQMSILSEEILKKQNMQNVAKMAKDMKGLTSDLVNTLENTSDVSDEEIKKLNNILKEIEEKIKKIYDMMKNNPKTLPDDFINQSDIKTLDFASPMDMISQIYNFLSKKDINSATALAKKLLAQIDNLFKSINEISSNILASENLELNKELQDLLFNLDKIIVQQEKIYQDTKEIDNYRISEFLKQQEKLISKIVENLNYTITKIDFVLNLSELDDFDKKDFYKYNAVQTKNKLKNILSEITEGKVVYSSSLIKEAYNIWSENLKSVESLNKKVNDVLFKDTKTIFEEIDKLNELLNFEPKIEYKEVVVNKKLKVLDEQGKLVSETEIFRENLKSFGKKSFLISPEDIVVTNQAILEMKSSKEYLEKQNFPSALKNQNTAINLLMELKNKFNNKQLELQQVSNSIGKPMGESIQYKHIKSGKFGTLIGRVLLPSAKDYVPPKELREDIIKSLSEKYPQEVEKLIQQYYRELLK